QVAKAIAVDVAGDADREAETVVIAGAKDGEALIGRHRRDIDARVDAVGLAEDHIGLAAILAADAARAIGPDDDVIEAVAVDVAGRACGTASEIAELAED